MIRSSTFPSATVFVDREQMRNLLHLWLILSMLVSVLSPLTTVGVGLPTAGSRGLIALPALDFATLPDQILYPDYDERQAKRPPMKRGGD